MRIFSQGAEIRLQKEDLIQLLEKALNAEVFAFSRAEQKVTGLTLHPNNTYVVRITTKSTEKNER